MVALLVARHGFADVADYRRFGGCLAVLVVFIGLFVFWDVFFDRWLLFSEMLYKPEYWMNRKQRRFGGIFLNPNLLGGFLVLVFPLLFIWTLGERRLGSRLLGVASLLLLCFALVQTQSRAPLIAFVASIPLLLFGPARGVGRAQRIAMFVGVAAAFAVLMPGFLEHASRRFESLDRETSEQSISRKTTWEYTGKLIAQSPVLGIGFGEEQYIRAMSTTGFESEFGQMSLDNPHNSYLQMAVYAGLPALAVFLLFNVRLLYWAFTSCIRKRDPEMVSARFGLAVGITGFLVASYPDMHLFTQNVAPIYWVFVALLLALIHRFEGAAIQPVGLPSESAAKAGEGSAISTMPMAERSRARAERAIAELLRRGDHAHPSGEPKPRSTRRARDQ